MEPELVELYRQLPNRIRTIQNYKIRRDLLRMYSTCENYYRLASSEQVSARSGRTNHRLLDLYNKFNESVTNLDQYVTLALLSI